MILGQHHSEEIFRSHIESYGTYVELSTELVGFEQDADGVTAHLIKRNGDSEVHEDVHAPFLIGADGAKGMLSEYMLLTASHIDIILSGITRKELGLTFLGVSRPSDRMIVGDIVIKNLNEEVCTYSRARHSIL